MAKIMRSKTVVFLLAVGVLLAPSAFGVQQLIQDGSFASLDPLLYWSEGGNSSAGINFFEDGANSFLSMANANGPIIQEVFQTVTVPTNTILLQVSYFWEMADTNDPTDSAELSSFLADSTDVPLTGGGIDNEFNQAGTITGFRQVSVNSTNLAGQTVDLAFEVQLFDSGAGIQTSFNIADVSMLAFTPADIPPNDYFTNSTSLGSNSTIIAVGTNILATKEPGETNIDGNAGGHSLWWNWTAPSNGVVTINTKGSTFTTLLGVFTGDNVSNLTLVAQDSSGENSQVRFPTTKGTNYQIAVDGRNGATGIIQLNVSFTLDKTPPKLTIKSPKSDAKLTNSTVTVSGTASDFVGLTLVQVQLVNAQGTNAYQNATGTTNWTYTITDLSPGLNTINVQAIDTSNNSTTNSDKVTYIVVSPLSLTINGSGTVSPNLTNASLDVGSDYTITAKPGTGEVLSNWTGPDGVLATTAALTFTMQSNLALTVNFVPNPFTPVVGDYQGLFYDTSTNGPQHVSSGFMNLTLQGTGSYSAKVMVAGVSYSLSGQFSAGGVASNNIVRRGLTNVTVQLQLDLNGTNGLTGTLSDGTWTAQLSADRIETAAKAAHYTLLIPGQGDEGVGGNSYATATVSATGGISFSGALADGTKISSKGNLLPNGQCPFYVGLYSGKGSIFGWLTLTDTNITGTVDWFKLSGATGKLYTDGITNVSDVVGSIYSFTTGVPVLNLTNGQVIFSGGNLPGSFTNLVTLSTANKITNGSTNALTMSITTASGLFKVTATDPSTGKSVSGNGVVLQNQNSGGGFFLGTNQSGGVFFGPASP